jgi:uncharacterized protein YbjT (DUF2867 family)
MVFEMWSSLGGMKNILVLGRTGKTGRRIARRLQAAGQRVRTAARANADSPFDLDDPGTWAPTLHGVTVAYIVEPTRQPGAEAGSRISRFVADAVAAGVRRLVLLSAHGIGGADDSHPLTAAGSPRRGPGPAHR